VAVEFAFAGRGEARRGADLRVDATASRGHTCRGAVASGWTVRCIPRRLGVAEFSRTFKAPAARRLRLISILPPYRLSFTSLTNIGICRSLAMPAVSQKTPSSPKNPAFLSR